MTPPRRAGTRTAHRPRRGKGRGAVHGQGQSGPGQVASCFATAPEAKNRGATRAPSIAPSTRRRDVAAPIARAIASRCEDGIGKVWRSGPARELDQQSKRLVSMVGCLRLMGGMLASHARQAPKRCRTVRFKVSRRVMPTPRGRGIRSPSLCWCRPCGGWRWLKWRRSLDGVSRLLRSLTSRAATRGLALPRPQSR